MGDLTRVDFWTLVQWRMELRYEGVDPDGEPLRLSELSVGELGRWLALSREIAARRPHVGEVEATQVREAEAELTESLRALADNGLRAIPAELAGIPLDPRLVPPEFRQILTPRSDQESGTEHTFTTTAGGAA